jgi:hypothetical protein
MRSGKVNEEQPSGESANSVKGAENVALSLAITKSNRARVVNIIPRHGPLTKAMRGFLKSINLLTNVLHKN